MKPVKGVKKTNSTATVTAVSAKPSVPSPPVSAPSSTTIEAKIDVGFGNILFVRGQGAGLNWKKGVPLVCQDSQTWKLSMPANEKLTFKFLLNDSVWAKGEDLIAQPGQKLSVVPAF